MYVLVLQHDLVLDLHLALATLLSLSTKITNLLDEHHSTLHDRHDFATNYRHSTAFSSGGTGSEEVLDWELTTHAMVAVGFGVSGGKDATPYWTIRNSWGKEFGDGGYFLYKRGENAGGIEHQAVWFQPDMDRLEKDLVVVGGAAGAGAGGASATGRGATGSGRAAVATASGSYAANKEKKSVLVKNSAMGAAAKALSAGEVLAQAMGK